MNKSKQKPQNLELILLPRGYISPSALYDWEKNRAKFIRKYFYGEDVDYKNEFMTFGKKVALYKEKKEFADDPVIVFASDMLPDFGNQEHTQTAILETPYGNIKLLGKFDDFNPTTIEILEHKTGKTIWTETKVFNTLQLRFYAVIGSIAFGKVPNQKLTWVQTTDEDAEKNKIPVRPTGRTEQFNITFSNDVIEETKKRITKACIEINREYLKHLEKISKS